MGLDMEEKKHAAVTVKEMPSDLPDGDENDVLAAGEGGYGKLLNGWGEEFEVPNITIKQIRDAIPAECFERNPLIGGAYVLRDVALILGTFYLAKTYITPEYVSSFALRCVLWNVYGIVNGMFGTGLWVMGHECGHHAFSPSRLLDDTVGFFCHTTLLTPYFSWQISHRKHHQSTNNMAKDMVYVPRTRKDFSSRFNMAMETLHEVTEDSPIVTLAYVILRQLVGYPVYLFTNSTGHSFVAREGEGRGSSFSEGIVNGINHFSPSSPIFDEKNAKAVILSDIGLGAVLGGLAYAASIYGAQNIALWYFLPYMWVNHWFVLITYIHHTDPSLPRYNAATWTHTRGAMATIDRDFGWVGREIFHDVTETHVLHHLVTTIPFYHARQATECIKDVMGKHYRADKLRGTGGLFSSIYKAYQSSRMCQWVEPSEGANKAGQDVLFYRNHRGLGPVPMKME